MGSPDVGGRQCDGARSVTESVQLGPHLTQPLFPPACNVLDDDDARVELPNDSGELDPQPGALSAESGPLARAADVLAWEAPADEVDGAQIGR